MNLKSYEIKNNNVLINGIPSEKWTHKEFLLWQQITAEILNYAQGVEAKLIHLAQLKYNKRVGKLPYD